MTTLPRTGLPTQRVAGASARPMGAADDLAALNEGNPLAWLALTWEQMAGSAPDFPYARFTGLLDGVPVGFAVVTSAPVAAGGLGSCSLHVLPHARRRGVGTALRAAVSDEVRGACPGLSYAVADDDPDGWAAAQAWGMTEVARHHESVLDLRALDRERFRSVEAGVETLGIALRPLPRDADDADWRALHAFLQARLREAPDAADGGGELPYEVFRGAVPEPWMVLLAERDGAPVGVTAVLRRPGTDDVVNTMFTGVAPAARGLGLSVALKARHAVLLAERGMTRLHTQNMVGNHAILAANARLGFVRDSGFIDVVDRL